MKTSVPCMFRYRGYSDRDLETSLGFVLALETEVKCHRWWREF